MVKNSMFWCLGKKGKEITVTIDRKKFVSWPEKPNIRKKFKIKLFSYINIININKLILGVNVSQDTS